MSKSQQPATAYSYIRFSSPEQARGDSIRRQVEASKAWANANGVRLDESLSLRDEGVSAFTGKHRDNPDRHALAAFLDLVKAGRIERGSFLIVESLDRLSREHIRPAMSLLLNLIDQGVRVVQLLPAVAIYDDRVEPMALMMAIMELSRGHSESRMKSERIGAAWAAKKRQAREGKVMSRVMPMWLRKRGEKIVVVESAVEAIRQIYRLAIEGHGITSITKRLNTEKVPPIGTADHWQRAYVSTLLATRKVLGEYQPYFGRTRAGRKLDGPPISNYFPAVVDEGTWHAARLALSGRRKQPGRIGNHVNIFVGLLRDARDGSTLHKVNKGSKKKPGPVCLVSANATCGAKGAVYVAFPLNVFEMAVLSKLREINSSELLPSETGKADPAAVAQGRLEEISKRLERIKAKMTHGDEDVGPLVAVLRTLESERLAVSEELSRLKQEAASPLAKAWEESSSLLVVLNNSDCPADTRIRLRSALRRIVSSIQCLFMKRGRNKLAYVQVWFEGGQHRDYLISHQPRLKTASANKPASWSVRSFASADVGQKGELFDLRRPGAAAELEEVLRLVDDKPTK